MLISKMTEEECHAALAKASFGRLACAHDNQPYIVPVYFIFDGKYLYSFAALGQKIDWMRQNPLVCVEADDVKSHYEWTSLVVFGRYEELPDAPAYAYARQTAHELLQKRPMWWQIAAASHAPEVTPICYRIHINRVTGHCAAPEPIEAAEAATQARKGGWLNRFLHHNRDQEEQG
jgi:nitroimidazol reductase NimA-like FMN-containing flavoprotein (pyridoxamine 5'-phosphate oxidase superfamily)